MVKIILDAPLILISFVAAYLLRFNYLANIFPAISRGFNDYSGTLVFIVVLWLAIFKLFGVYEKKDLFDEIAILLFSTLFASFALFGFLFLYRGFWFSRLVIINAWFLSFVLLSVERIIYAWVKNRINSLGFKTKRVLILGAEEMGQTLAQRLLADKALGALPIGFIDNDPKNTGKTIANLPIVGTTSQIKNIIVSEKIDQVIFATNIISYREILDIITECEVLKVSFKIVPGILEIIASRVDIEEVGGIPLITISEIGLKGFKALIKRTMDFILSLKLLILLSPLFLIVIILIKMDSKGAIFFAQERVGKDGKTFKMFKFRSMVIDAEDLLPKLAQLSETEGHIFKIKKDPRITRIGKWLRRLSIDEWPQLFNVLIGDMSLVGPRPPLPREVIKYSPWQKKRLRIAPGITGLWQVSGRSLLPFEDMVRLDIYYIENWSLWLDIKILFKTIPTVIFAFGAY
ncbi:MAG: UDP-phosphate glucose phosphotransferase [Candidatus Saganbacteria bacterium]|uniref:UDP-phosphate glucose phosphotransferase n=1 Tax=Candidatus Saganbacteria bacterium TaxID=2575572 RepID=A0A833L2S6_UNCSA|nr:MAG: UDP-phosphate glucose phosphotransferase [Candidatus Saganbacteria bacterium]